MIFWFVSSPTHLFIYGIYELEVDLEQSKEMHDCILKGMQN